VVRSSTTSSDLASAGPARERAPLVRFGLRLLWLAPLVFVLLTGVNALALRFDIAALPELANFHQQQRKLAAAADGGFDTLFLGDSSLGRMMDTPTWERITGERSLQLALTGGEGFAGDLGMLQRALLVHRPKRVVLVHTSDMPTRGISWNGYLLTRPAGAARVAMPPDRLLEALADLLINGQLLRAIVRGLPYSLTGRDWPFLDDSHVRGRERLLGAGPAIAQAEALAPSAIKAEGRLFLEKIAALCAAEGIDCRFAFGPVWEGICANSADYLAAARAFVEGAGLPVVAGTPLCVPAQDLDDTIDHVVQGRMVFYTKALHDRLEGQATTRN
jgi:hypothetical protein